MEAQAGEEEKRLRKEEIRRHHAEIDETSNKRFNTTEKIAFSEKEVYFPAQENPLYRINEVSLDGYGDFTIEVTDYFTTIYSTTPSTMKRVFWNRLNFNYSASASVDLINNETKMRIYDSDFSLQSNKTSRKHLSSSSLSKDEIAVEKFQFLREYVAWRYGIDDNEAKFTEWKVFGTQIEFINKRNGGSLLISNRSSNTKTFRLKGGHVKIDPFQDFHY